MTDTLLSGGADGADTLFGVMAAAAGHQVCHFSFVGHTSKVNTYILTGDLLEAADSYVRQANRTLGRRYPTGSPYVNNLLRRNYYQIRDTERVYAISNIDAARMVEGGTAWAVQMAIDSGIDEIYLFNQYTCQWNKLHDKYHWAQMKELPPRPHGIYTGIGRRAKELTHDGKRAIKELYTNR